MVKRLFKDTLIYGIGRTLSYGVSLLLVPLYTRIFAPSDYGTIDILTLLITLVNLTIALEIGQAIFRFLPDIQSQDERISYSSTALWFVIAVYSLFVLFVWLAAQNVSQWLINGNGQPDVIRVASLAAWAGGVFLLVQAKLRGQLQAKAYAATNITYTLGYLGFAILFVVVFELGVIGVFSGQLIGSLLGCGLGIYFTRRDYRLTFNRGHLKAMLQFSVPLVPSGIAVFVYLYIDRLMINELMSLSDVGIFGIGYRVATVVNLIMFGFQGALTPLIYNFYAKPGTPSDLARIFRYFVAAALLMCLGLSLFAREVLAVFTTPAYYDAASVIPFLTLAVIFSNMYIFAPGHTIAKKTGVFAAINVAGAVLNFLLNLTLIPRLGIQGAALATFTSTVMVFTAHMITSQRYYFVPHHWRRLGLAAASVILIELIGLNANLSLWTGIILKLFLMGLAAVFLVRLELISVSEALRGFGHMKQFVIRNRKMSSVQQEAVSVDSPE
jgi:O-antigen/teichoic acid export membrane protein